MKYILALIFSIVSVFGIFSQEIIQMRKDASGVYTVPCEVNGLRLRFILDTGASVVSISLTEATFMLKNGYLDESDIKGSTNVQTADGKIAENYTIRLKEVKIGSIVLHNIDAVVSNGLDAPLLLGQSVLNKFGHWSVSNNQLILNDYSFSQGGEVSMEQLEQMLKSGDSQYALNILKAWIENDDEDAAYLYLKYVVDSDDSGQQHKNNPTIIKAMGLLENSPITADDNLYWNYDRLIWFSVYRLDDSDKAIALLHKIEDKNVLTQKQYDKLAYNIVLAMGWGLKYNVPQQLALTFLNKGYFKAYKAYANFLKEGKGDKIGAYKAYQQLAAKGYYPGKIEMAICQMEGIGTQKNITSGLSILDDAANKGYTDAIVELCSRYYYGDGVKQNYDKVIQYARLFGNNKSLGLLKKAYTGIAYFGKKDYRFALQNLSDLDLFWDSRPSDEMLAAYNGGINRISNEILSAVGQCYENGLGCTVDFDKAYKYYSKLAENNPGWGYGMLGDMLFLNDLITSNPTQAYSYYRIGANNDNGYCYFRVALMNYYGVGTAMNKIAAQEYKKKAIELGIPESDFNF